MCTLRQLDVFSFTVSTNVIRERNRWLLYILLVTLDVRG